MTTYNLSRMALLTALVFCCGNGCGKAPEAEIKAPEAEIEVKAFVCKALDAWSLGITEKEFNKKERSQGVYFFDGDWYDGAVLLEYQFKGVRDDQDLARYISSRKDEADTWYADIVPGSKAVVCTVVLTFQSVGGTPIKNQRNFVAVRMKGGELRRAGAEKPLPMDYWEIKSGITAPHVPNED